jgi:CubicO group peptidase (beta-lactamase class C family)
MKGLEDLRLWIEHRVRQRRWGCLVLRDGASRAQWYGGGFAPESLFEIGSLRKSFNSALIGLGIESGLIDLHRPAAEVWPEMVRISGRDEDRAITLHHLATGVSGWLTGDPPGCRFVYSNAGFTAAERVVARLYALARDETAPLAERLFRAPLRAASWRFYHFDTAFDPSDIGCPGPKLAVESNLRDLVSWGELWLRGGVGRDGARLIPSSWVSRATSPANPGIAGCHYGYNWFLNTGRALWPGAPEDSYGHVGFGTFSNDGRPSRAYLWICPSLGMTACVVSEAPSGFGNDFLKVPNKVTAEWIARVAEACA